MIKFFVLLAFVMALVSCSNKDSMPAGLLKPEKMQAVLWDVIRADAFTTEFIKKDSTKKAVAENLKLQQQIFAIHKVSKADFYSSYDYYKDHEVAFKKIVDSMIARLEKTKTVKPPPTILQAQ